MVNFQDILSLILFCQISLLLFFIYLLCDIIRYCYLSCLYIYHRKKYEIIRRISMATTFEEWKILALELDKLTGKNTFYSFIHYLLRSFEMEKRN